MISMNKNCLLSLLALACAAPARQVWQNSHPGSAEDAFLTDGDFGCLQDLPRVGRSYFTNVNGHLEETLAAARGEGPYPVGTVVQLFPAEAMVKRRVGFSPETGDWEYFMLKATANGAVITARGGAEVRNPAGTCESCHGATAPQFDRICAMDHGCKPLGGLLLRLAERAVEKDPRCGTD